MTEKQNRKWRFHEAIRNAKGKQTKNRFLDIAVTDQGVEILSCAAGGAYLEIHDYASGLVSLDEDAITRDLEEVFPILLEKQDQKYPCPVCGDEKEGLFALISCLNDNHDYTRTRLADVIRPIEEAWEAERNVQGNDENNDPKITVDPIVYAGKPTKYKVVAEPAGEGGAYHELRVGFFDEKGQCVADAYFTVDSDTGEPRILITADGEGEGDPAIEVLPLRSIEAVIRHY